MESNKLLECQQQLVLDIQQLREEMTQYQKTHELTEDQKSIGSQLESIYYSLVVHRGDSVWPSFVNPEMKLKDDLYQQTVSAEVNGWQTNSEKIKQVAEAQHLPEKKLHQAIQSSLQCKQWSKVQTYQQALQSTFDHLSSFEKPQAEKDKMKWIQQELVKTYQLSPLSPRTLKQVAEKL